MSATTTLPAFLGAVRAVPRAVCFQPVSADRGSACVTLVSASFRPIFPCMNRRLFELLFLHAKPEVGSIGIM